MMPSTGKSSRHLLDEVQRLAQVEAFDPDAFARQLRDELGDEPARTLDDLAARDDTLRGVAHAIDTFVQRTMRIRLEHVLADDRALAPPFRIYLASRVADYADDLPTLHERVASTAARVDPDRAAALADGVVDAARAALALRDRLRADLFAFARDLAAAAVPTALAAARDVYAPDPLRLQWSAARRVLESTAARPEQLADAAWADRLEAQPPVLDEIDQQPAHTREELIELD